MRLHHAAAALAPLLLLPSCVGAPEGVPAPQAPRRPVAAPVRTQAPLPAPVAQAAPAEWQYRPATPGNWTYRAEGSGSAAIFSSSVGGALLTLRCDATAARVSVARAGAGQGVMTVRTSYGATSWPATADGSGQWVAVRAVSDGILDQIAYSRGHFAVEVQGLQTLILPVWAEVGRVIEDCRR